MSETIRAGYVLTDDGQWLVQVPDADSRWGFFLADGDQTWDGGFGIAAAWTLAADKDVPEAVRAELGWILDEVRS